MTVAPTLRRRRVAAALALLAFLALPLAARAAEEPANPPREERLSTAPSDVGEAPIFTAGPLEYSPGRGLRVGSTGLVVGGFTTVKAETTTQEGGAFALDNLNVFLIYDFFPRFRAVAELQFKDIFVADKFTVGGQDFAFDVRRLFGDYTLSDALRVRAGTFLTPVGYWNLILAPPLTWTTEAPLIVEETFFQPTTTGAMVYGSTGLFDGLAGYSVFSQFLQPLEDSPDLDPSDYTTGLRLTYDRGPAWSAGTTFQAANESEEWSYLGAAHVLWLHDRGEILSELYFQDGTALPSSQWGTYLQGVLQAYGPLYAVGRYEHYDQPSPLPTLNLFTVGGVYKPFPFMAVKVEYRFVDRTVEDDNLEGFFTSFTTFF